MTSIVTDFKSIKRILDRQEQKAEFEAKNPKEEPAYLWPYGVAATPLYGGASGGAVGAPFDARANLKAVLCDLKTDVALLARLERATIKI